MQQCSNDTIFNVRYLKIVSIIAALSISALLIYQIPAVNSRLFWRFDLASAYLRGVVNPVGDVPTPVAQATSAPTASMQPIPTATLGPTSTALPSPTPLPSSISLTPPEFNLRDYQGPNNCGPATLALYLRYYGWVGDQYTISDLVKPVSADRNVNIEELLSYARNNAGWLQSRFRVGGTIELLKQFLANGIPVMIEEGLILEESYWPNDDQWAGHYLLLTGYDDQKGLFVGQDTNLGPNRETSYRELDENWIAFNRVYFLLYHPSQEELVKTILGPNWEPQYNRQAALDTAQSEIDADSGNVFAWFNLGSNLVYFDRYEEAAAAYDEARQLGWPQRMLRYQFGPYISYFNLGRMEDLIALVDYNLILVARKSEEAYIWRGWALFRLGDNIGAIENFRLAHDINPTSVDALYALNQMGVTP